MKTKYTLVDSGNRVSSKLVYMQGVSLLLQSGILKYNLHNKMYNLKCINQWILTMRKHRNWLVYCTLYNNLSVSSIHHLNVNPVHISNHYTTRLMRIMNHFSSHSLSTTCSNLWKRYSITMLMDTWESLLWSYSWAEFFPIPLFSSFWSLELYMRLQIPF